MTGRELRSVATQRSRQSRSERTEPRGGAGWAPKRLHAASLAEHHANLLPWRQRGALELPVPSSAHEALERLESALADRPATGDVLVAVTGASNVTGEVWPLAEISALAHRYGARTFVDAAQLAPHRLIQKGHLGVDWMAFSGH